MGFGHVRRNIQLARSLASREFGAQGLLVSGIREAGAFALPAGVDSITLPAYRKLTDGSYQPRELGTDLARLVALRSQTIASALRCFEPDLMIVDNVPRGALNELDLVLPMLRERGTRLVLGLRDVLDSPVAIRRQWRKQRSFEAARDWYDAIWVYGDRHVYDLAEACGFEPEIRAKMVSVGYIDQSEHLTDPAVPVSQPFVLCMVGGGQDGARLTEAFAQAVLPTGHAGLIVTGSMMPAAARDRLHALASARPMLSVVDFVADPLPLIRDAAAVVAMAGYNTTTEILSLGKRALLVPRVVPREEQWIRASRLAAAGLVDCLHPDKLSAQAISDWLATPGVPSMAARETLDFGALAKVRQLAAQLLDQKNSRSVRHAA